ncbi:tail fiber assembly protein [Burkholderia ubonensis]|uniref:tail fiber assembly protein n=1 Tax=Burkholderia ubonensis TaxID=101571 RepID=UPI0007558FDA|nr:tail fiber assembly protein [Burkholderia ubonensis]KVC88166.1 tail fiber assembly protein [Burkholderia ubonensis]KVT03014.1 tail fiber assembly protein [Burkholderia ubonensis]KVT08643.1 tail fiber assembly protein [Burkholderia ubonensis]KVT21852.1 tail fiber assembly protein [Burkholderia ubonensis]KVT29241.1 tail fiber assembly protein [Burkholderia ubonensis]
MGQKFAAFDAQGNITAFYDSIDSPAPHGVSIIAISDEQWIGMLEGQASGKRLMIDDSGQPSILPPLPPTPAQIIAQNTHRRDELLRQASVALAPLQMAVALGDATDGEKEAARRWLTFTRALKAVDLTVAEPVWPVEPEISLSS